MMVEAVQEAQRLIDEAPYLAEWMQCEQDAAYFIDTHVIIDEPQGDTVAAMPFHLWDAQIGVLAQLVTEKLVIILKARQLGISWLCCAYALWLCLMKPGRVVLMFSEREDKSQELVRRLRVMYQRLPEWMRQRVPIAKDNTQSLEWANGSRVSASAATPGAGRSLTASLVLLDEFAFMQWGADVYTAVKPTIDAGGQLFIVSTANGEGDKFHALWNDALQKINNFVAIFLSWRARPGRDEAWRAARAAEALSPTADKQEYPDTADEAFQSTGGDRYLPSIALWDACIGEIPPLDKRTPCVLGLDAGVTNDCFAAVLTSRHWLNHDDLAVRYVRVWVPHGGKALDFDAIEQELITTVLDRYNVVQIAYDAYQLVSMSQKLGKRVWVRAFSQQQERMIADGALLQRIMRRGITHDGNPTLRAHADNANRKNGEDANTLRIEKRETSKKVDALVALSMSAMECSRLAI